MTRPEQEERDQDRAIIAAATLGPWRIADGYIVAEDDTHILGGDTFEGYVKDNDPNIIFIARARTRWPQTIEALEKAEARIAALYREIEAMHLDACGEDEYVCQVCSAIGGDEYPFPHEPDCALLKGDVPAIAKIHDTRIANQVRVEVRETLEKAEKRIAALARACQAADHALSSLLAMREGIADEVLRRVRDEMRAALAEPKGPVDCTDEQWYRGQELREEAEREFQHTLSRRLE